MQFDTPIGPVWAEIDASGAIRQFGFGENPAARGFNAELECQILEYFSGVRHSFVLPLARQGTPFQLRVWEELVNIPYGSTITYSELAERAGKPNAPRAAGRANATNPIAVIVPCHRVIGSKGDVTGYLYGVEMKKKLLDLEKRTKAAFPDVF